MQIKKGEFKMKNNIIRQKDDLSTGMLVRFRNGEHCYVLIDVQVFSERDLYFTPQTIKQLKL